MAPRLSTEALEARRQAWLGPDKTEVIAMLFGTSRGRLCSMAKKNGWPPRKLGQQRRWVGKMLDRLEVYWNEGVPRREIAEQLGTSESRIFQVARAMGLKARRPGRRRTKINAASPVRLAASVPIPGDRRPASVPQLASASNSGARHD